MSSKDHFDINFEDNSDLLSQEFFNDLFARYSDGQSDEPILLNRNPEGGYSQVPSVMSDAEEFIPLDLPRNEEDGEAEHPSEEDGNDIQEPEGKHRLSEQETVGKRQLPGEEPVGKRRLPENEETAGRRLIPEEDAAEAVSEEDAEPEIPAEPKEKPDRKAELKRVGGKIKEGFLTFLLIIYYLALALKNKVLQLMGKGPKKKKGKKKPRPAAAASSGKQAGEKAPSSKAQSKPRKPLTPEEREARRKKRMRQRRIAQAKLIGIFVVFVLLIVLLVKGCSGEKDPVETTDETTAPVETSEVATVNLKVVGDIMTHGSQIDDAYDSETEIYDFSYCLENVAEDLKSADYTIGNLETVMAGGTPSGHPLFNSPDALAADLAELGFDMVTTANNHCLDQTFEGLCSTLDKLDAVGIDHVGTYRSQEEYDANKGVFMTEVNGIKIAFVSYTFSVNGNLFLYDYSVNLFNTDFEGDMNTLDQDRIREEMAYAKSLNPDIIIACMHWGEEYKIQPDNYQKTVADFMIAQGASVVLGGHPHVAEPMEYRTTVDEEGNEVKGLVVYSLGNFISGQTPAVCGPYVQDTAILNLEISKTGSGLTAVTDVSYTPLYFLNRGTDADVQYRMYKIDEAVADYEAGTPDEYVTEEVYETMKQSKIDLAAIFGSQWTVKN